MIKVQNIDKERLVAIGRSIGEAFMAEPGVLVQGFTMDDGIAYFTVITEICYHSGCLYTLSDQYEGFVAYWTKKSKPTLKHQLSMLYQLLIRVKWRALISMVRSLKGWKGYEETYRKEKDYVAVFMLVVPKAFQGMGYMKALLSAPFSLAKEKSIPCMLDTDALIKAKKYEACGMKTVKCMTDDDITMYLMRYDEHCVQV